MNVKNYFLGIALLASPLAHPYGITAINSTDGNIVAVVERARQDICAPLTVIVRSNTQRTIDTGACCIGDVFLEKISGTNIGAKYTHQAPITNSDMSCKSSVFQIYDDGNRIKTVHR